ncbi:hypothetical protein EG329_009357 [Mollisiaceae sp. DMI_Dod_QoI]|nr:hypothetical protein EG329_009357 [Helotiales sp. DMI_Dod_QoI]
MHISIIVASLLFSISVHADTFSLLEALKTRANATKFAEFLEANPEILAVYNSSGVQTVFAPTDAYFTALWRRDTTSEQQLEYQYTSDLCSLEVLNPPTEPGAVVTTGLPAPQAGGSQATVSQKLATNSTTNTTSSSNSTSSTTRRRSDVGITPTTGIQMLSGLGNHVNILKGDIPYCNGLIQTTDGQGYLPTLTDGASFQTLAGDTVTISIRNGVYFVNDAKIISSNAIIENGVAHVIDKVLVPTPSPVVTSGSSALTSGNSVFVAAGVAVLAVLMM